MTGTPDRYAHLLPRPFRIAHMAWAAVVLLGCVALALSQVAQHGSQPRQWLVFVVAATVHAMAFVVLLLRWQLARYLVAVICVGWGLALALQFREPRPTVDLLIAIVVIAVLVAIAAYVVLAKRIRSALR